MSTIEEISFENGIPEWYAGKNIFITGSTGFMGKVLVEKLLRDCPNLNRLYLMIRTKRGTDPLTRKDEYLKSLVFKKLLENNPNITNKIHVIKGDILDENLGLNDIDRNELIKNIDIIIHCAANVRFDQPLKIAVEMNVGGTEKMLKLAEKMENLKVFTHVSTSYCHCNEDELEEREYPIVHDPLNILIISRTLDDKILKEMTPGLLNGLPNTYAFSKAVTEKLICRYGNKLPIVICRPSIVTSALKEPIPGWVEGVNGPTGLMIGGARGIIRTMHCNPDHPATVIPVDTAINGIIAATWDRGQKQTDQVEFYNTVVSNKYLMSWGECITFGKRLFYENPLNFSLWYPGGDITSSYLLHIIRVYLFHILPAYFVDICLYLLGKKPFLVNIQKRISLGLETLQYYTTKTWNFKNDRLEKLQRKLNSRDQEKFELFLEQVCWEEYILNYIMGMRLFIIKESLESMPQCKRTLRRLYILDRIVTYFFYGIIFWFLWNNIDSILGGFENLIELPIKLYKKQSRIVLDASG